MTSKLTLNQKKIFFLNILFIIIPLVDSVYYFQFPTCIPLTNKNLLIIHKYGVGIANTNITEYYGYVVVFNSNEYIDNHNKLQRIATLSNSGLITCIINDKIYIFSEYNGNLLYSDTNKVLKNNEDPPYYSISPITLQNEIFYYI